MTKVQNPIIGRSRGSAGGMTFTKNYDKNIMRSKPFEVKNPRTTAQVTQRNYFAGLSTLVASFTPEQLRTLFPNMPKAMSRRNALSKQLAEDVTISGNVKSIDFAEIDTIGNASTMDFGTTSCTQVGSTITVTLDNSVKNNAELADMGACAVLVNETLGEMNFPLDACEVPTGTFDIAAPSGWLATHSIHAIPLLVKSTDLNKDGKIKLVGFGTLGITKRPAK